MRVLTHRVTVTVQGSATWRIRQARYAARHAMRWRCLCRRIPRLAHGADVRTSPMRNPFAMTDQRLSHGWHVPTLSRRQLLGAGVAVLATTGCGQTVRTVAEPPPTQPLVVATPGSVSGYTAGNTWQGWTLRVAVAGTAIHDAVIASVAQPFAAATGCTIEPLVTDYHQIATSVAEGEPYADVAVVDPLWAIAAGAEGLLLRIDRLSFRNPDIDLFDTDRWSVPAYAYAMVNAYRQGVISPFSVPPEDWTAWWNAEEFPGPRTLMKGAVGTFEFALMADGVAPDDLYPLDYPRAIESLKRISGSIVNRWWETTYQPVEWLSSNSAVYASAWSHRLWLASRQDAPIAWNWDQGLLTADRWVVPDGILMPDLAFDFIQYATQPAVQAALARTAGLGPVTSASFAAIGHDLAQTLPTAPENLPLLVRQDLRWWSEHQVEANQWFNDWLLGVANA